MGSIDFYRPQRSWVKVMFLQVCVILFTGGVSASVHAGIHPLPLEQTPPPRSRHPPEQTPPQEQTPLGADTPPGADTPLEQTPPGSRPPLIRPPLIRYTTRDQVSLPRSRLWHTVNERPVRILLECILVMVHFTPSDCRLGMYYLTRTCWFKFSNTI